MMSARSRGLARGVHPLGVAPFALTTERSGSSTRWKSAGGNWKPSRGARTRAGRSTASWTAPERDRSADEHAGGRLGSERVKRLDGMRGERVRQDLGAAVHGNAVRLALAAAYEEVLGPVGVEDRRRRGIDSRATTAAGNG